MSLCSISKNSITFQLHIVSFILNKFLNPRGDVSCWLLLMRAIYLKINILRKIQTTVDLNFEYALKIFADLLGIVWCGNICWHLIWSAVQYLILLFRLPHLWYKPILAIYYQLHFLNFCRVLVTKIFFLYLVHMYKQT